MDSSLTLLIAVLSIISPSYEKRIKIEEVTTCTGKQGQLTDISGLQTEEGTAGWGLFGQARLDRNLPNGTTLGGSVYKHLIRWIPMMPIPPIKACDFISQGFWTYKLIQRHSDLPTFCPVAKNTFTFNDDEIDDSELPWYAPSGCVKIELKLNLNNKAIACYKIIANIVRGELPKKFQCLNL